MRKNMGSECNLLHISVFQESEFKFGLAVFFLVFERTSLMKARTARSTKTATERYKRKAETLSFFFVKTEEQHALRRAVLLKTNEKKIWVVSVI